VKNLLQDLQNQDQILRPPVSAENIDETIFKIIFENFKVFCHKKTSKFLLFIFSLYKFSIIPNKKDENH